MKTTIALSNSETKDKLSLEMDALISVLKNPSLRISDGLKRRYFARLDEIMAEIEQLKVAIAMEGL